MKALPNQVQLAVQGSKLNGVGGGGVRSGEMLAESKFALNQNASNLRRWYTVSPKTISNDSAWS